jgi:hypothetical protein
MAIIHSKIAQSPSRTDQSQSTVDMPMMHIPLHSGINHNHLGPISKLLDAVSVAGLTQQTTPSVSHTTAHPQRQPKQSRTRKSQKSQVHNKIMNVLPNSIYLDTTKITKLFTALKIMIHRFTGFDFLT